LVILAAFSLGAGLAQSLDQVIAFRALQGVGGAGLYSLPLTTLPEITPPEQFGVMSAAMGIVFAVSAVLWVAASSSRKRPHQWLACSRSIHHRGPTIGGVITTHSTWRWVFYFNLPCCGFVIALILVSWPKTPSPGRITLRQLDLVGCLLFIIASVPLVFALQEGGAQVYAWDSAAVVVCLVLSGAAMVVLGVWIWHFSKPNRSIVPLFPQKIVTHRIMFANLM
jgi:MFS family permease